MSKKTGEVYQISIMIHSDELLLEIIKVIVANSGLVADCLFEFLILNCKYYGKLSMLSVGLNITSSTKFIDLTKTYIVSHHSVRIFLYGSRHVHVVSHHFCMYSLPPFLSGYRNVVSCRKNQRRGNITHAPAPTSAPACPSSWPASRPPSPTGQATRTNIATPPIHS